MCIPSELRGDKINDTLFWGGILTLVLDQILTKSDVLPLCYGVLLHWKSIALNHHIPPFSLGSL